MPIKDYKAVDLYWSVSKGDLRLGANGDIGDTSNDPYRAVLQNMTNRARSNTGDWSLNKDIASDVNSIIGQVNSAETAQVGVEALINAQTKHGFIHPSDLSTKAVPIAVDKILFIQKLSRTEDIGDLSLTFLVDVSEPGGRRRDI